MLNRITDAPILPNRCCTQPILGRVHHSDWLNNCLPDKSVQLIIADPPYFETKGDFDFVWKSFDDYLIDVEKWAIECKRLLAENGTLYWFGGSKKIAYTQIIFDKYFVLVNNLVWEKAEADGLFGSTGSEQLRSYPNSTERILMYSTNDDYNEFSFPLFSAQDYLKNLIYDNKGNVTKANDFYCKWSGLNGNYRGIFFGKSQYNFYTEQQYNGICEYIKTLGYKDDFIEYKYFLNDYNVKQNEYLSVRRQFENVTKSTEILKVRFKPSEYDHPTVKPEMLARTLILTSSRKNDLVLIPFAGSGTEVAMAIKEGRQVIGFDVEEKYCQMSNNRINKILSAPELFV